MCHPCFFCFFQPSVFFLTAMSCLALLGLAIFFLPFALCFPSGSLAALITAIGLSPPAMVADEKHLLTSPALNFFQKSDFHSSALAKKRKLWLNDGRCWASVILYYGISILKARSGCFEPFLSYFPQINTKIKLDKLKKSRERLNPKKKKKKMQN